MRIDSFTARACSRAALALLIAAIVTAGCGGKKQVAGEDPSPSAAAAESPSPSPSPSPSAEPTPSASTEAASPSADDAKTEKPAEASKKPADDSKKPAEDTSKPADKSEKPAATPETQNDDSAKEETVKVEALNWEWKLDKTEFKAGQTIKFEITGKEGMHAFSIVGTDIKENVDKDKTATVTWKPEKAGEYVIKCALFCGTGHSGMQVKINVA